MIRNSRMSFTRARRVALVVLVACATVPGWTATRGPDAGGYLGTDSTVFSFVDISGSGGGASILAGTDDGTATLAIPFPFLFYGQAHSLACVSSNGALYFVPNESACAALTNDFSNTDLALTATPGDRPAVLPLWSDLTFQVPGAGAVFYQTAGPVGNRKFVVQWNNAYPVGSANPVTFQVVLSEGSNSILFQYKTVGLGAGNPANNGAQATVGIRNANALTTQQQVAWSFGVPVIHDSTALLFSGASADTTPPSITASATPSILWPPNGKAVAVTVAGSIADAGSGVDRSSGTYRVVDSFGEVQPSGTFAIAANGIYSFKVSLIAAKKKNKSKDKDDRRLYTITVSARDMNGNQGSRSVVVTVPHDQGI